MKRAIHSVAVAFILTGCTTFYYLSPSALSKDQTVVYIEGYEAITEKVYLADDGDFTVSIFGYTGKDVLILSLFYGNATNQAINVLPDQVIVEGVSDTKTELVKVWEANKYIRKIKLNQNISLILQAFAGALEASRAGKSTTNTYGSYYGSTGYGSYSGRYSGYSITSDSSKVAEVNARNTANIAAQARANEKNLAYLDAVLLKRTTLAANSYIAGVVYCDRELFSQYEITVPFGNRLFFFSFKLMDE